MTTLDELCALYGVAGSYLDVAGELKIVPEATRRALLSALGADLAGIEDHGGTPRGDDSISHLPTHLAARCFVPECLQDGRVWGIALQLYQLRSQRSLGIGDFRDLCDMAPAAAEAGADFIGVNPLHALFTADPSRCSPFSPSNRRFLNPLYIAIDEAPGYAEGDIAGAARGALNAPALVDYPAVGRVKLAGLRAAFTRWLNAGSERSAFDKFVAQGGQALADHAAFEALSGHFVAAGRGAGWKAWPASFHDPRGEAVRGFIERHAQEIEFHLYLQWVADLQLQAVAQAARQAGMRIGLYLDLAVGEAPDGSAGWSDPKLVLPDMRVGAPPDYFNAQGQDWGLAPFSPRVLAQSHYRPLRDMLDEVLRHAGAIRIDHVMGLLRLFLIPAGKTAAEGAYIRYAFETAMETVAAASQAAQAVIIGEDLGNVPDGFRELMAEAHVHSYRILYFEREGRHLAPPEVYPVQALACISTHDMTPLAGWWRGGDIDLRLRYRLIGDAAAAQQRTERQSDLIGLLAEMATAGLTRPYRDFVPELDDRLAAAVHGYLAAAPARLFAVRLEDMAGEAEPVNLPSTSDSYPNWRRRFSLPLGELVETPRAQAILAAVAAARPRS